MNENDIRRVRKQCDRLATWANGEIVNPKELKPGDRFRMFQNQGSAVLDPSVDVELPSLVYVHDGWNDGWEYHEAATGLKHNGVGETSVVRLLERGFTPLEKAKYVAERTWRDDPDREDGDPCFSPYPSETAQDYVKLHATALKLCRKLQAPLMEYLRPDIQNAWSELFDLLEDRPCRPSPAD